MSQEVSFKPVRFVAKDGKEFGKTVRKRVNEYFKTNKIARTGDYRIWLKVVLLPLLYLFPFGIILTNNYSANLWAFYGLWISMGVGLAGVGLGIMHDACHGAISKKKKVNDFVAEMAMMLAGGSTMNWKIQHNVLHHSYTNIDGLDEDINPGGVMRFSPHQPWKSFFKFQVFYAWFLYGLMTFFWATFKDFLQLNRYCKMGLIEAQGSTFRFELVKMIFQKVFYYALFIVLPIMTLDVAWYHIVGAWFCMHLLAGLILGCVFQPAHVIPSTEFPLPDKSNTVESDLALHQLMTTANFAPTNKMLSWYVGGLNYQIEHHLFPSMSHLHHRDVSKIVKETAEEFGLPYHSNPTFIGALVNHAKMLRELGKS